MAQKSIFDNSKFLKYHNCIFNELDCGGCNLKFVHPLYYRLHCNVFHDPHYSLTIRKYHCKICGKAVLGKENIVKHASNEHDGRGAYQCQYCKKVINTFSSGVIIWLFLDAISFVKLNKVFILLR